MTDAVPTPAAAPWRPLAGFVPIFSWGLRYVVRWRKVLLVAAVAVGIGALIGFKASTSSNEIRALAKVLDKAALSFGLPLIALLLVGDGFSFEVSSRTLGYHLVRPVSRTTIFLARFFAGALPAVAVAVLFLLAVVFASGVPVPKQVWVSLPVTATLAILALGAIYYALGAVFRRGLIVGLLYTFVVEMMLANVPGSMQKLSMAFHVRALHHQLTDGALPSVGPAVRPGGLLPQVKTVTDAGLTESVLMLAIVAVVALAVAAWVVSRRDYALKE